MEERNRLVLEAASMLSEAPHAVDDAAAAHALAQDALVRRLRRGDNRRGGGGGKGGGKIAIQGRGSLLFKTLTDTKKLGYFVVFPGSWGI